MPSFQSLRRNGEVAATTPSSSPRPHLPPPVPLTATPSPHHHHPTFHSTISLQKLRRFNSLVLVFRVVTFSFSFSSSIFMLTNSRSASNNSDSFHWFDFDAFRFVLAAAAIVAVYSLFEIVASVWEITWGATLFPEFLQVWFDFGHDQVFAYMLLSAESAGTALAKTLKTTDTCTSDRVLLAGGHIRRPWIRRLPLLGLLLSPFRLPRCLFHSQRLSISPLTPRHFR